MSPRSTPVTFFNRAGEQLFGVLTEPADRRADTAILLLCPGMKMRVGPHRLYLGMAKCFAALGYAVLRFDFAGLGDSEGEILETETADLYGAIQAGRYVDDVSASIDWLEVTHGIRTCVAAGLCGGAITALLAAERDQRITSVLGLGMPVIVDGSNIDFTQYMTAAQLAGTRSGYLRKFHLWDPAGWQSWWRFITLRSHYSLIARSLVNPIKRRFARATPPAPGAPVTDNTNPRFAPAMRHVLATGRPVLLVFGEEDRLLMEYSAKYVERYQTVLNGAAGLYQLHVTSRANHIFSLKEWQDDMLERCSRWLRHEAGPTPAAGLR